MLNRLVSTRPYATDMALLLLRIFAGLFMMLHGIPKLTRFSEMSGQFADPFGLGTTLTLILVIFAEVFCAALVIVGAFTRIALIPLIINMSVIALVVHGADGFGRKELPFMFLLAWIVLFLTGPGRYSLDNLRK